MDFFLDSPVLVIISLVIALLFIKRFPSSKTLEQKQSEDAENLIRKFFTSEKTHFRNSFSNKFLLARLKDCQKNEGKYAEYLRNVFAVQYLKYTSFLELSTICMALTRNDIDEAVKSTIRSTLTAASILFDFELPPILVKLDGITYDTMAVYILMTRRKHISVLLKEYENDRKTLFYQVYTEEQLFWLYHLASQYLSMAQFFNVETTPHPPAFHVLVNKLKTENDELWMLVNKSEDNLKLLMTFTFAMLGYEVPKDCYAMNDFLFCLLKNNGHYPTPVFEEVPDTIPEGQAY
jgi:hypothetical protein